jgi:nucleoside-diphosphate-sugar epimerase
MMIEESFMGRPFTLQMAPDVKFPFLYVKDAALAMLKLAQADESNIRMVNYVLNGIEPLKTAQELVELVKSRLPQARLTFEPDEKLTRIYHRMPKFDDRCAREEWGWQPEYDHERMIDDFTTDLKQHPERYT